MVEFEADSAIEHIGYGSTIVHSQAVFVLKRLIWERATLFATALCLTSIEYFSHGTGSDASNTVNEYILKCRPTNSRIK